MEGATIMTSSLARVSAAAIIGAFALGVAAQTSAPTPAPPAIPSPQSEQPATSAPEISAPSTPDIAAPNAPAEGPKVEQNFPTPAKPSSSDSPQLTTNAPVQALAEYDASKAFCMTQTEDRRDACLHEAEEGYHRALRGDNPGQQGNPGSTVGERGTPRS
jgi:hypothetical protein